VHCTAEFFAANMTVELDDTDKLRVLLNDAKTFDITLCRPTSTAACTASSRCRQGGAVRPGRDQGHGQSAIEAIIAGAQRRRAVHSAVRLLRARRPQRINKRSVEALIKAGAFDALHPSARRCVASIALAFD
jgi:DNA polymerase-3 subunit alpha